MSLTEGAVTGQFLCATCLATFKSVALQLHEQECYTLTATWNPEVLATRKTVTEEDRGENNKDPDWLIEQSIVRQVAGGVLHCATAIKSCCNRCATLRATKMLRNKLQG